MVKKIPLTQRRVALVDDEDYDKIKQYKWCANKKRGKYYAYRVEYLGLFNGKQKQKSVYMHRVIMNAPKGMVVDHINHDTLDNRKENLRITSNRQNLQNNKKKGTSKYPGVYFQKRDGRWVAHASINGERIHLGMFNSEISAAKSYEMAGRLYCGENLVCKIKKHPSYKTSDKFTPRWELPELKGLIQKTSKYKGVFFDKHNEKWRSHIQVDGKQKMLGSFCTEEEAHNAYLRAKNKH